MPTPSAPEPRTLRLRLLETEFALHLAGSAVDTLERALTRGWERCLSPGSPVPDVELRVVLDDDDDRVRRASADGALAGSDERRLMDRLTSRLTQDAIESRFGQLWMLHACALAHPETGATVVLVAASGTGKTTAARALGRVFGYLTDETAAIRSDGFVVAYPKPLSLLVDGVRPKRQLSPGELGLHEPHPQPRLAALALLDRRDDLGGVAPHVEPVRMVDALPALAAQTSALRLHEQPLQLMAGHLRRTGGLRRLVYQEAGDLEPMVRDLMEGSP